MKNYIFILFIIAGAVLTSCVEDATDVKLPTYAHQMVVSSFITPDDSIIKVKVAYDSPIYGTTTENILESSAIVVISDDKDSATLSMDSAGYYSIRTINFPLEYGKTYNLSVTNKTGEKATSSCTIPYSRDLNVNLDTTITTEVSGSYTWQQINVSLSFKDFANETNYYAIKIYQTYYHLYFNYNYDSRTLDSTISIYENATNGSNSLGLVLI